VNTIKDMTSSVKINLQEIILISGYSGDNIQKLLGMIAKKISDN